MRLPEIADRRPVTTVMVFAAIALFGLKIKGEVIGKKTIESFDDQPERKVVVIRFRDRTIEKETDESSEQSEMRARTILIITLTELLNLLFSGLMVEKCCVSHQDTIYV